MYGYNFKHLKLPVINRFLDTENSKNIFKGMIGAHPIRGRNSRQKVNPSSMFSLIQIFYLYPTLMDFPYLNFAI